MTRWNRQTKVIIQNKYIPGAAASVVEQSVIPVGRGRTFPVNPSNDVVFSTCIEILARKMAQTKWKVYGSDNKEINYLTSLFNRTLNIQPFMGMDAYSFWETIEKQRLYYGNAFAYIVNNGLDLQLIPLDAGCMQLFWDDANILDGERKLWYQYTISDNTRNTPRVVTIPADDILHFKAFSMNGLVGRRALDVLRDSVNAGAESMSAMRSTVNNGFSGSIILSYSSDLSQLKRKELANQVKEFMSSTDHAIVPLPAGINPINISTDVKSYFTEMKQCSVKEISSLFGIPLVMLNEGSGAGVATLSTNQITQFHTHTIQPILEHYKNVITMKLLTPKQINRGYTFDCANDEFDYLDSEKKSAVLCSLVNAGIITRNEARESLLYQKVDDPTADSIMPINVSQVGDGAGGDEGGRPKESGATDGN